MIDNVNLPAVRQEIAALTKVATEGMRIINQLTQSRYEIGSEIKQEMREACLIVIRAHVEAFTKDPPGVASMAPMSLEAALKTLKSLSADDDSMAIEYARMHQDLMIDLTEVVEKVRVITMPDDELLETEANLREAAALEEKRHH